MLHFAWYAENGGPPTPLSRCCRCCFCCLISKSEWQLHFCFRCCVRFLMMFPLATRVHAKTHIKQVEKKKLLFVLATCECVWISAVWLRNIFGESATFITFMNVVGCRLFFFFFCSFFYFCVSIRWSIWKYGKRREKNENEENCKLLFVFFVWPRPLKPAKCDCII